jgi:energy-converting hydrogenase Eha subunit B
MHRPTIIERVIAVLVAALALQQGYQGILGAPSGHDPRALVAQYFVLCLTGLVAAYGIWRGERWGAWALAVNGGLTALMVWSIGPILDLPPEGRSGLWIGAGVIALLTGLGVWYVHRRASRLPSVA